MASSSSLLAAALLLSLSSCAACGASWLCDYSSGSPSAYSSMRLYLPPSSGCNGLELEFVRTGQGIRLYLNVFGLEIPATECDETVSEVYVSFGASSYCFLADRFLGGQRLLIPKNVQEDIVGAMQSGQTVFIQVDRYQSDIYPNQFLKLFQAMVGSSSFSR